MGHSTRQLSEGFHFLGSAKLVLKLSPGGHVHHRADETERDARSVTKYERSFENVHVIAVGTTEPVLAAPLFGIRSKRVANTRNDSALIGRVQPLLPEADR